MMTLLDKQNSWSWLVTEGGVHYIAFEDGEKRPLKMSDVMVERGKYQGKRLSDVLDVGYLQWMSKLEDNWFVGEMAKIRLKELK